MARFPCRGAYRTKFLRGASAGFRHRRDRPAPVRGAGQTGGQCPSGHHDQNFYWKKTRICGRAQITHLEWMTRRSGKKVIRPAKKLTGRLLPRHDIGLVLFAALSAVRAECKDVEVSERMCCNFQKSARERLVGSTRLRLLICTQN